MIQQYVAEANNELKPGERQYFELEPKAVREERAFNKHVDLGFKVFGWDSTPMKGVTK